MCALVVRLSQSSRLQRAALGMLVCDPNLLCRLCARTMQVSDPWQCSPGASCCPDCRGLGPILALHVRPGSCAAGACVCVRGQAMSLSPLTAAADVGVQLSARPSESVSHSAFLSA
jgi:hypothetical protein